MLVFEGLFPDDHDTIIQTLLYRFAQWHALAKLRLHSETTLTFLDETFKKLSHQLRKFRDFTCVAFTMVELPKEKSTRERKDAHEHSDASNTDAGTGGQKGKKFNMNTYKFHAMGDYVHSIRHFGTVDSFTSQIVHESFLCVHISIRFLARESWRIEHSKCSIHWQANTTPQLNLLSMSVDKESFSKSQDMIRTLRNSH